MNSSEPSIEQNLEAASEQNLLQTQTVSPDTDPILSMYRNSDDNGLLPTPVNDGILPTPQPQQTTNLATPRPRSKNRSRNPTNDFLTPPRPASPQPNPTITLPTPPPPPLAEQQGSTITPTMGTVGFDTVIVSVQGFLFPLPPHPHIEQSNYVLTGTGITTPPMTLPTRLHTTPMSILFTPSAGVNREAFTSHPPIVNQQSSLPPANAASDNTPQSSPSINQQSPLGVCQNPNNSEQGDDGLLQPYEGEERHQFSPIALPVRRVGFTHSLLSILDSQNQSYHLPNDPSAYCRPSEGIMNQSETTNLPLTTSNLSQTQLEDTFFGMYYPCRLLEPCRLSSNCVIDRYA
ncbi:hypothetical protein BLNAU_21214 [Blattamonas nauphoetae]|uniref:Uncharacterized protein n=1 Tax=Blattamonas nauphoetae TaxID=2049346 RepID=A0ABQ9WWJ6_9EUKA|nr:hypothetical protein BLNAU_21214 [Blattamonas nauphoetae]